MTTENREWKFETTAVHGGLEPDPATGALAKPIYQTTSYVFRDTQHAANLFSLAEPGNIYTRIMNPTTDTLERRIAALEGGVGAVAFASGQAAITATILTLCRSGDEFITSTALYGGTHTLFTSTLSDLGIRPILVDNEEELAAAFTDRTKLVYCETIGNPKLTVPDLGRWAELAHQHGVPLVVDNTFATPYLCRPIEYGADIVIHSLTKWIGGHGNSIGGIVVDAGRFDYHSPRYPQFSQPDASYHGLVFADLGEVAFLARVRTKHLRDTGACLSPFNAFLILLGTETLSLRVTRESENALELAQRLRAHPAVRYVQYPGLEDSPGYALARRYFHHPLFGAVLNFGIAGGIEAGRRLVDAIPLWSHVANVGDVRSLIIHPASTTHSQLSPEEQMAAGVAPDLIRLSVGVEHVDDLWAALDDTLRKVAG